MLMELDNNMEYAIKLIERDDDLIYEEVFKLASLCEDIQEFKSSHPENSSALESKFSTMVIEFYWKNGQFRSEIERFPPAKSLINHLINKK